MDDHSLNSSRIAERVAKIGLHEHLCAIYETHQEQLSTAIPFMKIGLERGEKCVYIAGADTSATVVNAMRKQKIDVDAAVRQGSFTITSREIYPHEDFDPDRMIEVFAESERVAKSAGFSVLRLIGEMTWVVQVDLRLERLLEFEAKLNHFYRNHDALALCQYDRRRFQPEIILGVLRTHPTVVYGGCVCENPYFIPAEEFLHPPGPERQIQRMLARMQESTTNLERLQQSEERIRQSSEQHSKETRALIDAIPQQIWSGPPDGSNDFANARLRSYVGLSREEMHGRGWEDILHPDDRERVKKAWHESVTNGTPFEQEERHRGADGNYRWFLNRGVPMRDAEGRILRWYGTNTDIEDRKQTEDKLRRSEAYLAEAQKLSHTGSWAYDPVRRVPIYWSAEWYRITGLDPAEGPSVEKDRALHTPEEWSRLMEVIDRAVREKVDYQTDSFLVFPNGAIKYVHIVGHPIVNASDEVVELVGIVMDVTERKQAEEEVRRLSGRLLQLQDEERRKIARDLHDVTGQNLVALATMIGQLRTFIPMNNRKPRRLLSQCKALANKCIREVRTLSYVLHPPVLEQAGLVGAVRDYVKGFTKRSGIHVDLHLSPRVERMERDIELALFRVIQESLTNVQRHSGSKRARIRITRNSDLRVEISDHANGASGNLRRGRCEFPFESGVGIPSMQERVKLIGGRLEIGCTRHGTTVRVTLPLGDEREKAPHFAS